MTVQYLELAYPKYTYLNLMMTISLVKYIARLDYRLSKGSVKQQIPPKHIKY